MEKDLLKKLKKYDIPLTKTEIQIEKRLSCIRCKELIKNINRNDDVFFKRSKQIIEKYYEIEDCLYRNRKSNIIEARQTFFYFLFIKWNSTKSSEMTNFRRNTIIKAWKKLDHLSKSNSKIKWDINYLYSKILGNHS